MLGFQVLIVLLLVAAGIVALVLQARAGDDREAGDRSLAVAETFAHSPGLPEALASPDPTSVLQPEAEAIRHHSQVDFVVVMNTAGIRYTHPRRDLIGKHFIGDIRPALRGQQTTEHLTGAIGPLVQAVVPVTESGKVIGLVAAGVTTDRIQGAVDQRLPVLVLGTLAALAVATLGAALVSRRLRRQTHGLGPAEMTRLYEHHDAVLHAVREGVAITDPDGRLLLANDEAARLLQLPEEPNGRHVTELGLPQEVVSLLTSPESVTDEIVRAHGRPLAVSTRPTRPDRTSAGRVATLRDYSELRSLAGRAEQARERLDLLYTAGTRIGATLDVTRTAEHLCEVAVGRFADYVTVELAEPVLRGEEPPPGARTVRVALGTSREDHPLLPAGTPLRLPPSSPQAVAMAGGTSQLVPDVRQAGDRDLGDPAESGAVAASGLHSLIAAPLRARGVLLGVVSFWRSRAPGPFDHEDRSVADELAARAAVSIDNARRYTREHDMAVTLQHSLLPRALPEQNALDVASRYLPAQSGVGGDWFDVIPLSGARVAVVVGDVVGHGLHAAATMGRLRTAVHNFSALDLHPDEILGHLDELVMGIDEAADPDTAPIGGATCLYAIYDPVTGRCDVARAGHLPPALLLPDGTVHYPDVPAGLPLGVGGMPFETTELTLAEGTQLVLYTDGLVENRDHDIDEGLDRLRAALESSAAQDGPGVPEHTCQSVLDALLPDRQRDDIALLVARTRVLAADHVATWDLPADPAAVPPLRSAVSRQLTDWGLESLAFSTELIVSELVTNAIRHGGPPVAVRLIKDHALITEVADGGSTAPHLKYAASTDEGGRGLFLVSQMAVRWGTRYTPTGKVIWAQQNLEPQLPEFV
ncbi:SpoIIE family protein phosphatase [Streptomyces sp. NPDC059740]|uniref:SpoIIE family protein phosphatase n=1 Tax=Streptomyces sp. NPDC059740 TaxID=3346926 RepID=UPI003665DF9C